MIEILMYLFENYLDAGKCIDQPMEKVAHELEEAGFLTSSIHKAFQWLLELSDLDDVVHFESQQPGVMRHFSPEEQQWLDLECQSFLLFLCHSKIISLSVCEIIIDRVLALGKNDVTLSKLKWVTLMVLFKRPGEHHALMWIQDFILNPDFGRPQ